MPSNTASWWYVFGSASFVLLMLQIVTGILLAIVYVPSAGEAWNSLQVLNQQLPLGWFLRAMHGWGSNFMVAVVLIHMAQVFLFGAYKFPRELTWILGVFLLLMTLGMAFTGQVMRFDQDAYWGLGIGASIVARVPFIGGPLVDLLLGGPIIAGPTLTRFFALHVFVIPGMMLTFAACMSGWCRPGHQRLADAGAGRPAQHLYSGVPRADQEGRRAFRTRGGVEGHDLFRSDPACGGACAVILGPFGPTGFPDPTIIQTVPKPDFFFLWIYTILSFLPENLETPFILIAPIVGMLFLLALAVLCRRGGEELAPAADRCAVDHGAGGRLSRSANTWEPTLPGVRRCRRGAATPSPYAMCITATPLGRQGQIVFQEKQCRNCHMLGGSGWRTRSGARWSGDQLDLRPAGAPGAAGRRKHAGLRKESFSRRK